MYTTIISVYNKSNYFNYFNTCSAWFVEFGRVVCLSRLLSSAEKMRIRFKWLQAPPCFRKLQDRSKMNRHWIKRDLLISAVGIGATRFFESKAPRATPGPQRCGTLQHNSFSGPPSLHLICWYTLIEELTSMAYSSTFNEALFTGWIPSPSTHQVKSPLSRYNYEWQACSLIVPTHNYNYNLE